MVRLATVEWVTKADTKQVDICITTPMKELERVCLLAEALADRMYFGYLPPACVLTAIQMECKEWFAYLMPKCQ